MSKLFISSLILIFSFSVLAIEEPSFQQLDKDGDFEVRLYDQILVAEVTCQEASSYDDCSGENFRVLFNYISGTNDRNEKIDMTAPVIQTLEGQKWTMAFAMPASYLSLEDLPEAYDKRITLKAYNNLKVGVIVFSGFVNTGKINKNFDSLLGWLKTNDYNKVSTDFMIARYNSPWALPFFRRNEIWTKVQ